jgi:putative glutamine transport system substrate-binding protein
MDRNVLKVNGIKRGGMKTTGSKYLYVIAVVFFMLLTFGACSGDDAQVKAIRERGVLRVGVKVDVPNFGYMNPDTGEIEGMEVDLARALAKEILGDGSAIRLVNITAQTRGPMLDNGEIDLVIATFTVTEERKTLFNFSRPYYNDELGYLVQSGAPVEHPGELDGKTIGVAQAGTAKRALEDECALLGVNVTINQYASYPEVKDALIGGMVEAFVADKSILFGYLDEECVLLEEGFNPQQYCVASKLENDKLAAYIDGLLDMMEKNGALDAICEKWGL